MTIREWVLGPEYVTLVLAGSAIAMASILPKAPALARLLTPSEGKWNSFALALVGIIACIVAFQQCVHLGLL